jgi:hypothetical protein
VIILESPQIKFLLPDSPSSELAVREDGGQEEGSTPCALKSFQGSRILGILTRGVKDITRAKKRPQGAKKVFYRPVDSHGLGANRIYPFAFEGMIRDTNTKKSVF